MRNVSIRRSITGIPVYIPAKAAGPSAEADAPPVRSIRLSANETTLGASPLAVEAVRRAAADLFLYPDPHQTSLREKLALKLGVGEDQLIFGNGSFELLSLSALAFLNEGDESVYPVPSFGWYRIATLAAGGIPVEVALDGDHRIDLAAVRSAVTDATRLVWLCNPNNPTGTYLNASELDGFLHGLPDGIAVVVDEAYFEYASPADFPDTVRLLDRYPNLIVLRTFSKAYGLAGLRVGYGIAGAETVRAINRIRPPLNVNRLAEAAAVASLDDEAHVRAVLDNNSEGKAFYVKSCRELGLSYIPSETNFIMVDLGRDSGPVYELLLRDGIQLRAGREFGMPTWLRVTIGRSEENRAVVDALRNALQPSAR
ncbi:histidinol-phosphate transaminase [Cohnella sp. GbtcB17]|uniref:histidinol-phosphate transaminase n=1 Tax=Cohnella sp. GbtcB17 TaxID=2824762 RepID=UPI001C30B1DF|nr:histidinol-phosphate transaminase [Cohnella sp. GbtcB17]